MPEKKVEEKEEKPKPYHITIPDWITFLGNKSSTNVNLLVFTGYVSIIALIALLENTKLLNLNPFLTILIVTGGYFIFYVFLDYMGKRTKLYQDLLEEIIKGKITNLIDIRRKYGEIGKELEKKWWRIKKIGR
jgi:hypothetical protein